MGGKVAKRHFSRAWQCYEYKRVGVRARQLRTTPVKLLHNELMPRRKKTSIHSRLDHNDPHTAKHAQALLGLAVLNVPPEAVGTCTYQGDGLQILVRA